MNPRLTSCLCLGLLLLGAVACSHRAPAPPPSTPLSPEALTIYRTLLVDQLVRDGQPDKALEVLRETLAAQPTEPLYLELAGLAWRLNRFPEALATLAEGVERYPDSRELRLTQARALASRGRHGDAAQTLLDYLVLQPDDSEVRGQAAAHLLDAGEPHKALDLLAAMPRPQRDARYFFLTGKALVRQGHVARGIQQLEEAAALDPDAEEIWIEMALAYERQGNLREAERIASELLRLGKGSDALAFHTLELNLRLGNPDKGVAVFLEAGPAQATLLDGVQLLLDRGLPDHAAALLEPLLTQGDPTPEVRLTWALVEARRRQHAKALEILAAVPEDGPVGLRALALRILILHDRGDAAGAEALARQAVARFPEEAQLRVLLAEVLDDAGRTREAEEVLRQGLEQAPTEARLLYRLGMLLDAAGRKAEAMEFMERLVAAHPSHADGLNYIGYTLAEEGRDLERAERLIRAALVLEPDNGYFVDSLAWVLFRQGRAKLAWAEIQRAVTLVDDPVIWEHYGDIAASLGLVPQARRGYTEALRLNPKNPDELRAKLRALGGGHR